MYLLNIFPSNAVPKPPFEFQTGRKLDSRIVSGYFVSYPEKSKGFRFYSPNHNSRIIETENTRFIENDKARVRNNHET